MGEERRFKIIVDVASTFLIFGAWMMMWGWSWGWVMILGLGLGMICKRYYLCHCVVVGWCDDANLKNVLFLFTIIISVIIRRKRVGV